MLSNPDRRLSRVGRRSSSFVSTRSTQVSATISSTFSNANSSSLKKSSGCECWGSSTISTIRIASSGCAASRICPHGLRVWRLFMEAPSGSSTAMSLTPPWLTQTTSYSCARRDRDQGSRPTARSGRHATATCLDGDASPPASTQWTHSWRARLSTSSRSGSGRAQRRWSRASRLLRD